jgi:hypothetical protein
MVRKGTFRSITTTVESFYCTTTRGSGLSRLIKRTVEEGAINAFKAKKSRKPKIDSAIYQQLKAEKERLETVILELSSELALLKKKIARFRR